MSKVHPKGKASETHTVRTGGRRPEPPGHAEGSSGGAGVGARRLARFLPRLRGSSRGKQEAGDSDSTSRRSHAVESWQGPPRGLQARSAQALPAVPSGDGGGQQRSWPKSPPMSLPLTRLQLRPGLHTPAPPESPVPLAARATTSEQASVACGHCPHLGQHRDLPAPQWPPPRPPEGDAAAATRPEGGRRAAESPGPRRIAPRVRDRGPSLLRTSSAREAPLPPGHGASPCAPACAALDTGLCGAPASGALAVG